MKVQKSNQNRKNRNFLSLALLMISISILYWQMSRLGYVLPIGQLADTLCFGDCAEPKTMSHLIKDHNQKLLNYEKSIAAILGDAKIDPSQTSILIEKSQYKLTLYYQKKPIKSYPVVFGNNPIDDKLKQGDSSTPEGTFKIKDLYPHQSWSKFIWLDYPNKYSWRKHFQAKLAGKINWYDSIGGEIGIHGGSTDLFIENRSNWTLGCISLTDQDVDELYQLVQTGTEVEIIK